MGIKLTHGYQLRLLSKIAMDTWNKTWKNTIWFMEVNEKTRSNSKNMWNSFGYLWMIETNGGVKCHKPFVICDWLIPPVKKWWNCGGLSSFTNIVFDPAMCCIWSLSLTITFVYMCFLIQFSVLTLNKWSFILIRSWETDLWILHIQQQW